MLRQMHLAGPALLSCLAVPLIHMSAPSPASCDASDPSHSTSDPNSSSSSAAAPGAYPNFSRYHTSFMRRHLTPSVYASLSSRSVPGTGETLDDVISCGTACGYSIARNMGTSRQTIMRASAMSTGRPT